MAKAPQAGYSKTRLSPPLSPEAAAALAGAFLADTARLVERAAESAPIDRFVAFAPADAAVRIQPWLPPGTAMLVATGASVAEPGVQGFGCALLETVRLLFARGYGAVVLLSADGPNLPSAHVADAARHLLMARPAAALGPSRDGGYYLLGLTAPLVAPFRTIGWSTDRVAATTRTRLAEHGVIPLELPVWYDVDDDTGLAWLRQDLATGADAPATRAMLARLETVSAAE